MIFEKDKLPKDWDQTLTSVGCYLMVGNEFLMLKRSSHKSQPNLWQLPGGKVDKGESELEGIVREVFEETGIQIPKEQFIYLDTVYARYEGEYDFTYHMYKVILSKKPEIILSANEHGQCDWFTIEKSLTYPLLKDQDGAIQIVKNLL